MNKLISLFVLLPLCICCSKVKKNDNYNKLKVSVKKFENHKEIICKDTIYLSELFDLGGWKIGRDRAVFFSYDMSDGLMSVYSYPEFSFLYAQGKIGAGPDEYIAVNWGETKDPNRIIVYDIMNSRLNEYIVGDSLFIDRTHKLTKDETGLCKPSTKIHQLKESIFLQKQDFPYRTLLEITDLSKGEVLDSQDILLKEARAKENAYTPFDFHFSVCGNSLLLTYNYIDRIELYSLQDNRLNPIQIIGNNSFQTDVNSYNDLIYYNLMVVSDENYFYCLKSINGDYFGNLIEVYDNEGSAVVLIELDNMVESIAVDGKGTLCGYASEENKTVIYRYIL